MSTPPRGWADSERFVPRTFVRPFIRFSEIEASSGIVLLAATIAAVIWANSAWSDNYFAILGTHLRVELGSLHFDETVEHFINDGLMAAFFFVVGLEIKRELTLGDLRDRRAAALPVAAAIGGMVLPAVIYLLFTAGQGAEVARGWGIPMATDIAFALGIVALLRSRIPSGARLFLLSLAIADDIGVIAVIAIFYTSDLRGGYLAGAVLGLLLVWWAGRSGVRALWVYVPAAVVIWVLVLESGVHATLAGVALGLLTPARPSYDKKEADRRIQAILDQSSPGHVGGADSQERSDHQMLLLAEVAGESVAPLTRMEHALVGWSSFLIIPVFALANAGVDFRNIVLSEALGSATFLGVAAGLVIGKTLGISLASFVAVRLGLGVLPPGTTWRHVVGLAAVAGVGFTVSLFVTGLAFEQPNFIDLAKLGIFVGSLIAGVLGALVLIGSQKRTF